MWLFGPENLGVPPLEIRKRVDEALKAVDMYEYREHAPISFPAGQKAAGSNCRHHRHGNPLYCAGQAHRHAGPQPRVEVMETIQRLNRESRLPSCSSPIWTRPCRRGVWW